MGQKWSIADLRRSKNTPRNKRVFKYIVLLSFIIRAIFAHFFNCVGEIVLVKQLSAVEELEMLLEWLF